MKINIPDLGGEQQFIEGKTSVVLVGANGAGKTRMSVWIESNNREFNVHRISAQKVLDMPKTTTPTEMEAAEELFAYGMNHENKSWLAETGKKSSRWGGKPETHMLNDYQQLMTLLMTENYEKSIEYREKHRGGDNDFDNETRLEKIQKIWEDVVTHRKLKVSAGKVEVLETGVEKPYNGSEMSDGERAIFYYIGEVLSVKENSLIIIDEPENHLHKAILARLWNVLRPTPIDPA